MPADNPDFNAAAENPEDDQMITVVGRKDQEPGEDQFLEIVKLSDYLYEKKVPASQLKANIARFLRKMGDVVAEAPQAFGAYELHEIELSAEVTLSGDLKLLDVEGKAGLKFVIRRQQPANQHPES